MITCILATSALVFTQAGAPNAAASITVTKEAPEQDVALDALTAGRMDEAIQRIDLLLEQQQEDPALLINLAAAHLSRGDYQSAADAYRRAAMSDDRYLVEVSDGSWVDSRFAALRALHQLERRSRTLASR